MNVISLHVLQVQPHKVLSIAELCTGLAVECFHDHHYDM